MKPILRPRLPTLLGLAVSLAAARLPGADAATGSSPRLVIHLDARDLSPGAVAWIDRAGTATFSRLGRPRVEDVDGVRAVILDGKGGGFVGPVAPPELCGSSPRTVEVCVLNPEVDAAEESLVAWGRRGGPAGANFAFGHGSSTEFGAVTCWAADLGWKVLPEAGEWHHLAVTYEGTAARLYADGVPAGERTVAADTAPGPPILVGAQNGRDGRPLFINEFDGTPLGASAAIASVRIWHGAMSPEEVRRSAERERDPAAGGCLGRLAPPRDGKEFRARFSVAAGGLTSLRRPRDPERVEFLRRGAALGDLAIRHRSGSGAWREAALSASGDVRRSPPADAAGARFLLVHDGPSAAPGGIPRLRVEEAFEEHGDALIWSILLRNSDAVAVEIGDLGLPLPMSTDYDWDPEETFRRRVFRHASIAGAGSFLYWLPVSGTGPVLVMTPLEGTGLEHFTETGADYARGLGRFTVFVRSAASAEGAKGSWRQPQTSHVLGPGEEARYGFAFRWADSLAGVRDVLARAGGFDIRVAPGMVVPRDLSALVAVRTGREIERIEPEFPGDTTIAPLPPRGDDARLFRVEFRRLGENRIVLRCRDGASVPLEFFATLPLEDLVKRRASFIAARQQHRVPGKWYDGLFSLWDRRQPPGRNLLGPENLGGLHPYMVSGSDDPSNGKCLYLAEKNVAFPEAREVEALEYFVERFVWGKHQRTDRESPHPYGIYGCDSWRDCRESAVGLGSGGHGQERMWRTFDYTTYFALYYDLYRIARQRPDLVRYLDARGYLERAWGTARAYFEVPWSIEMRGWAFTGYCDWAWKVGNFHEKYLLPLIEALEREGEPEKAARLRGEWEKKVKYMIYDNPWPFASEMPVDSTAYESTYAAGRYALERGLRPDENLWFDKNRKVWYSHPTIDPARHERFLARQHAANLACRGAIASHYWSLGSDFRACGGATYTLSYMSQMGGWAVLDFALRFDQHPAENLRLGYASLLSSWALVNADGAASWAFEPKRYGPVWASGLGDLPRGAWPVDGEIDHGLTAGVEAACTVLFDDPAFGLWAYGGSVEAGGGRISVVPRDGVRQRFAAVLGARKLRLSLDRDGFAAGRPIVVTAALDGVELALEPRSPAAHETELVVEGLPPGRYRAALGAARRTVAAEAGRAQRLPVAVRGDEAVPVRIEPEG